MTVLTLLSVMSYSCQDDMDIDTSNPDTNNGDSVFTAKAKRNTMFDGSLDDILDLSPCTSVQLPVDILLNTVPVRIENTSDLAIIGDGDVMEFSFPITLTNYNYEQITVGDQTELSVIMEQCKALMEGGQGPIGCVEIEYPITVFTATDGRVQNDFSIGGDQEFYLFLTQLGPTDRYSIKYPLSIAVGQDAGITVNDDSELEGHLDSCST